MTPDDLPAHAALSAADGRFRTLRVWSAVLTMLVPACWAHAQTQTAGAPAAATVAFRSPTDSPAARNRFASSSTLLAVAQAGSRLVAVGQRGNIVISEDEGKTWRQAQVPVETDLVAICFPTASHGWAVGHRGVVLESTDGGSTWVRRFGDQQINELVRSHYESLQPSSDSVADRVAAAASRAISEGSVTSLLDVWFDTPTSGTIVGAFNTVLRTEDGGRTWTPWMDRTDNPDELHFYAVRGDERGLYLVGERGLVLRLQEGRWVAAPTGYGGTLFGLVVDGASVLAYGMRGNVFISADSGRTWHAVPVASKAGLVAGLRLSNGDIVLADQAGNLLRSRDGGRSFTEAGVGTPAFSFAQNQQGQLMSVGPRGVVPVTLK